MSSKKLSTRNLIKRSIIALADGLHRMVPNMEEAYDALIALQTRMEKEQAKIHKDKETEAELYIKWNEEGFDLGAKLMREQIKRVVNKNGLLCISSDIDHLLSLIDDLPLRESGDSLTGTQ